MAKTQKSVTVDANGKAVYTLNAGPTTGGGFRRVSAFGKSVFLGNPDDAAEAAAAKKKNITLQLSVTGYLIGVKVIEKAGKGKGKAALLQRSVVLHLQTAEAGETGAEVLSVFSGGQLSWLLLTDYDNPATVAIKPEFKNKLIRVTYLGRKEVKNQPQPVKDYDLEVNDAAPVKNVLPDS